MLTEEQLAQKAVEEAKQKSVAAHNLSLAALKRTADRVRGVMNKASADVLSEFAIQGVPHGNVTTL